MLAVCVRGHRFGTSEVMAGTVYSVEIQNDMDL